MFIMRIRRHLKMIRSFCDFLCFFSKRRLQYHWHLHDIELMAWSKSNSCFYKSHKKINRWFFFYFWVGCYLEYKSPYYIRYLLNKFRFELIAPSSTFHLELEIFKYIESHHSNRIVNILLNFSMSVGVATTKLNYRIWMYA